MQCDHLIENLMKNDKLFHLQGSIFCLVFLVAILCYAQQIKEDVFQENIFHLFLKAICGMLALSFLGAEKPLYQKLFLNSHLMV